MKKPIMKKQSFIPTRAEQIERMEFQRLEAETLMHGLIADAVGDDWRVSIQWNPFLIMLSLCENEYGFDGIQFKIKNRTVQVTDLGNYLDYHNELQYKLNEWLSSDAVINEDKPINNEDKT